MWLFVFAGSIRRALVTVVLASVLPALGLILYSGFEARRHALEEGRASTLERASYIAWAYESLVMEIRHQLEIIAEDFGPEPTGQGPTEPGQAGYQPASLQAAMAGAYSHGALRRILAEIPRLSDICLADADGRLTDCGISGQQPEFAQDLARKAMEARRFIPGNQVLVDDGRTLFAFAVPLGRKDAPPVGALVAYAGPEDFLRHMRRLDMPPELKVTVADNSGKRVCSLPDLPDLAGRPLPEAVWAAVSSATERKAFSHESEDRARHILAFIPVRLDPEEAPFAHVLVDIPEEASMAVASEALRRNLLLLGLVAALALCTAWVLWRPVIGARFDRLSTVIGRLGAGDFSARIPGGPRRGELGRLEGSVNAMARALAEAAHIRGLYEEALKRAGEELDTRVRERTAQLWETNRLLRSEMLERGRAKLELAKNEEKYRSLYEQAAAGTLILDNESAILDANPAALALLGLSLQEIKGKAYADILHPESLEANPLRLDALPSGHTKHFERLFVTKDGRSVPVDVYCSRINQSMLQVVFTDATERKRFEQLRDDVERITRHDLKTPLMGIVQVPELLLRDKNLTPRQKEFLGLMREAGYRMLRTINMSLALYRMETGRYECERVGFDLLKTARSVAGELGHLGEHRLVSLSVRLDNAAPARGKGFRVTGEEHLCVTMLENLVKNALEASPAKGNVSLEFDSKSRTLTIRNQGEVPPGIRERFFEKYSTSGKRWGTGLGTYSARLIAATHGWDMRLDASVPGETSIVIDFKPL